MGTERDNGAPVAAFVLAGEGFMRTGNRLSSRERVRLALEHRQTDRIPIAMVCSGINEPAREEFDQYVRRERGCDLETYLESILDIRTVAPEYLGSQLAPDTDVWGVKREPIQSGLGVYQEIDYYPLATANSVDDIARHTWPRVEWYDYSVLPERIAAANEDGEHCIMVSNGNPFETSWYMRGFERMLMDISLNPEVVHSIMRKVTDFYIEYFRAILSVAADDIDLVFTADDIGGQNGLLMSLDMWRQFIKPYHAELNKALHEFGVKIIYHSDGAVMEAVPGLIDMGIDVLQALQFDAAGMDPGELKDKHGHRLCFEGGVSVQKTLPFDSPDDVREEVKRLIATLGAEGGYILGPSHAIQAGTPAENIFAMFETALGYYPFD